MALRVVTFFVDPPKKQRLVAGELSGQEQVELLYRSAKVFEPDIALTILTSPETDLSRLTFQYDRVSKPIDHDHLTLERARMQLEFVKTHTAGERLLFVDSDILVAGSIAAAFSNEYDIGLTWRHDAEMPFNIGVMFVSNGTPAICVRFFRALLDIFERLPEQSLRWYGDQIALAQLVNLTPREIAVSQIFVKDGIRFRFFPCETYNYTPLNTSLAVRRLPDGAKLIHFKGNRRPMMEPMWRLHLDPAGRSRGFRELRIWLEIFRLTLVRFLFERKVRRDSRRRIVTRGHTHQTWRDWLRQSIDLFGAIPFQAGTAPKIRIAICDNCAIKEDFRLAFAGVGAAPTFGNYADAGDPSDVVLALGLFECAKVEPATIDRIAGGASWLILAYSAREMAGLKPHQARGIGWKSLLTADELRAQLDTLGYTVVAAREASDRRSVVFLCRHLKNTSDPAVTQ